jgi:membrane-associated phospholipid phosphatase
MKTLDGMKTLTALAGAALAAASLGCSPVQQADPTPAAGAPDPGPALVVSWNDRVLAVAEAEDRFLTLKGLRTAAMMHLAIHDALNAIDRRYEPYLGTVAAAPDADAVAAAAQAAFEVASDQYPREAERFAAERDRWLAVVADGPAEDAGRRLGSRAAAAILAAREGDGWDTEAGYRWHPMGPGVYAEFNEHSGTPEGFVFGAGWAKARPFMLADPTRFRVPPPPAIDSPEYAAAYDEVKEVGRFESPTRTADQSHLAMWWKEFVEKSHNRLARELAAEGEIGLWEAARLFALLEASIYDGYVAVFADKFHYNHWRPYTAIRWASNDGNPATEKDPDWDNLHRHTYPFPSYPSAHGTVCAAAMTVLADVFGDGRAVTMTIPEVDAAGPMSEKIPMEPPTRSFDSFAAAAEECALSRVYLGIHFRYDSVEGNRLGRRIGEFAVGNSLRPVPR